jgi:glycine/D-amino acid oxidase-like deaminating enzyme
MPAPDECDVLVVGAGIVGLVTALLTAEAGLRVALVTAEPVGGGSSGRSAGVVSQLHGAAYSRMRGETAARNAAAYRAMNADGFTWLLAAADRLGVPVERRDALLVADEDAGAARIDDEHLAARRAGLEVEKVRGLDMPFHSFGGLRLPDQAVVDPAALLAALARAAVDAGVELVEGERVTGASVAASGASTVQTTAGSRSVRRIVLATGTPVLDRGLYLLKTQAFRILASAGDGATADGAITTVLNARGSHTIAPSSRGVLVLGGAHPVGVGGPESRRAAALEAWSRDHVPGFEHRTTWSGQDYRPYNPIAFVGGLPRGLGKVRFATGFDGWGLTNGAAAAIRITAGLLGEREPAWARTIGRRTTRPISIGIGAAADAQAAARRVLSVTRLTRVDRRMLAEGRGVVHREADAVVATSRVDGTIRSVSGQCSRFGGALVWNDLEHSWDCPVCGSRFAPDGAVLEGGARVPLEAREVDPADWGVAPPTGRAAAAIN